MKTYNHFINGEWVEPAKNGYFDTENPFTGEVWAKVARGCEKDADQAVKAAKAAEATAEEEAAQDFIKFWKASKEPQRQL